MDRAIGIFDSGLGGLTVAKAVMTAMPRTPMVYLGDTAHVPYGNKSVETVRRLSLKNVEFLIQKKVTLILVACNTASAIGLELLQNTFSIPILGVIEPGAKAAAAASQNQKIGVIGTPVTIASRAYDAALRRLLPQARIFSASCPLFVPLVEEGLASSALARQAVAMYLAPLKKKKIDTLVLGCTHYPLLKKTIAAYMGRKVRLIDSAEEIAREARVLLGEPPALRRKAGTHQFYVTDVPHPFSRLAKKFLGKRVDRVHRAVIE